VFVIPGAADAPSSLILMAAALAGGLVRGFTGFGFAMAFVPVASMAVGPANAVALIWLLDAPFAFPLALRSFPRADWREVLPLLAGATVALPLGVALLIWLDRDAARWIIAVAIGAALAALASGWRYKGAPGVRLSLAVGGLSGLFNGLAQLGGMPLAIFWLGAQKNDQWRTRDNLLAFFALSTIASGIAFLVAGVLRFDLVFTALPLGVAYGLGLAAGARGFRLASEQTFRRVAYLVIGASVLLALPALDKLLR